jgi:hypothetical protein
MYTRYTCIFGTLGSLCVPTIMWHSQQTFPSDRARARTHTHTHTHCLTIFAKQSSSNLYIVCDPEFLVKVLWIIPEHQRRQNLKFSRVATFGPSVSSLLDSNMHYCSLICFFYFLQIYNLLYKLSNKQICYKERLVRSNHKCTAVPSLKICLLVVSCWCLTCLAL